MDSMPTARLNGWSSRELEKYRYECFSKEREKILLVMSLWIRHVSGFFREVCERGLCPGFWGYRSLSLSSDPGFFCFLLSFALT